MLALVHEWVSEAAAIARRSFNVVPAHWKADHSPVTDADTQIEALLRARIGATFPEHGIVGEEEGVGVSSAPYVWAIDPIDGTSSFVNGLPVWGISVGLLHHGVPVLGCFHMPAVDEWYEVDLQGPPTFNGHTIAVRTHELDDSEAWICVPSNVHRRYTVDYPGKVRVLGSVAAYLAYVARGTATGALIGRAKLWDLAGTSAILARAGGEARYLANGELVDLATLLTGRSTAGPLIAGSPQAVAMLRGMVKIRR